MRFAFFGICIIKKEERESSSDNLGTGLISEIIPVSTV